MVDIFNWVIIIVILTFGTKDETASKKINSLMLRKINIHPEF
jgi:hypothetical protein